MGEWGGQGQGHVKDGQPYCIKYLDKIVSYIMSYDGVWQTTADDIAEYYMAQYYGSRGTRGAVPLAVGISCSLDYSTILWAEHLWGNVLLS